MDKTVKDRRMEKRRRTTETVGHHEEKRTQSRQRRQTERRSLRVRKRLPVKITVDHPDLKGKPLTAVSREVGEEGIFLDVEHHKTDAAHFFNHKDYKIDIEIHLPEEGIAIKAATETVRVVTPPDDFSKKRFGVGLKFVDILPDRKAELTAYLRAWAKSDPEIVDLEEHSALQKERFIFTKHLYLGDTNALGNAYFARYFDWQGMAREEFLKRLLPDSIGFFKTGMRLSTVEAHMTYKQEAVLYDEIDIEVSTTNTRRVSFDLIFVYRNKKTGKKIGEGWQRIAVVNAQGKLAPFPLLMRHNILKYQINESHHPRSLPYRAKLEQIKK